MLPICKYENIDVRISYTLFNGSEYNNIYATTHITRRTMSKCQVIFFFFLHQKRIISMYINDFLLLEYCRA